MIIFYPWQETFLSIEEAQKGGGIQPPSSDITIPKSSQFEAWTSHITLLENAFIVSFRGAHSKFCQISKKLHCTKNEVFHEGFL